jgi:hypothetical protein
MPFTTQQARLPFKDLELSPALSLAATKQPGDRCFVFYRELIRAWKAEPRWTTAHELYKHLKNEMPYLGADDQTAYSLAWQVFFNIHVMDYERKKLLENGEVE